MEPLSEQEEFEFRLRAEKESGRNSQLNPEKLQEDSEKYGSIRRAPSILEKIVTNLTSPKTRPLGGAGLLGLISSATGHPEEHLYPMIGQLAGSGSFLGSVGGSMAGQGIKQAVQPLRGNKPDLGEVGREGLVTGAIEGATRGAGNFIFRRQIANNLLSQLGKKLGSMKQAISANPDLSIPSDQIYFPLKQAVEEIAVPHGPQSTIINKWLRFMENNPSLSGKHLIELESDLGEVAKFGEIQKGAFVMPSGVKKPSLNSIAKETRRGVSNAVDKLAEEGGQKGFGDVSKQISKLLRNPETTDVTRATGGFGSRLVATGAVGGLTRNPLAGIATYFGMQMLQSPELRNLAFKTLKSTPAKIATTGSKLTLAELARRRKR